MKKTLFFVLLLVSSFLVRPADAAPAVTVIRLPEPDLNSRVSLEQAIKNRRSVRSFTTQELKISQIGQLCWSGQGITDPAKGLRTAPSAGSIYPMQLHVVLPDGLYVYEPNGHELIKQIDGDIRPMLFEASFRQQVVQNPPCIFIISGSVKKVEAKYRNKGEKFICLEAGHIAQNIQLQAVALGLGSVPIGGFDAKSVARICKFTEDIEPLYLICTGIPTQKVVLEAVLPSGLSQAVRPSAAVRAKRVAIVVLEKYFDNDEFFGTQEAFQIAGIQTDIASLTTGEIKSLEGRSTITATMLIKDIRVDDYDAFVFVRGQSAIGYGGKKYQDNKDVSYLVQAANERKKVLAAIDTAPGIFAYAGIVKGKNVASSPLQQMELVKAGAKWQRDDLILDGNLITASGPDAARRFGAAIVHMLRQQGE